MKYQLTTLANFDGRTSAPRLKKLRWLTPLLVAFGVAVALSGQASAYSNSRLMDDQVFDNVGSLNAAQVADFLAARTGPFTKLSTPSPCLSGHSNINFHWDNVKWHYGSDADWNTAWGPAQIAASDIIYKAAQMWGINPQVLLATLHKEQSLITGSSCDGWRYNSAMGYGCPDSGGCNPKYAGFSKQVLWGAWQLKFNKERSYGNTTWDGDDVITYVGYMTQGTRKRCGTCTANYYDGYATIDGQTFYLENGTTASLYTYTPHLGQSFPGIFQGWFGSAVLPSYSWQITGQNAYKYGTTTPIGLSSVPAGEKVIFEVKAKNTGTATWTNTGNNPIRIGTSSPFDRSSPFCETTWVSCSRPTKLTEPSIAPGEIGTFKFAVQAPSTPGNYSEYFTPLSEGVAWMNDIGLYFYITVVPANYSYSVISNTMPTTLNTNASANGTVTVRNDGNATWFNTGRFPMRLGTASPFDRPSEFKDPSWLGSSRLANMQESSVLPGAQATFATTLRAPATPGVRNESFSLVAEGLAWSNQTFSKSITVKATYDSTSSPAPTISLVSGNFEQVTLQFTNNSTSTWTKGGLNPVRIGASGPFDRQSTFCDPTWIACHRPVGLNEDSVAPGETGTFTFTLRAKPSLSGGTYRETFQMLAEGLQWFGAPTVITVNVASGSYSWSITDQYAYTDETKTIPVDMSQMSLGQVIYVGFKARNTGKSTWHNDGPYPVRVGTASPFDRTSLACHATWIVCHRPANLLETSVAPGQIGTFEFRFKAPMLVGSYNEYFDPIVEGHVWMNNIGLYYKATVR